jgi:protein arginine N-methyltransferase 1
LAKLFPQEGEMIKGELSCKPNARNPRDLDITIFYEVDGSLPSSDVIEYKMCVGHSMVDFILMYSERLRIP